MLSLMAAPTQVRWNYTYACNFNCSHCYTRAEWYPKELSPAAYARIADHLVEAGVFVVGLGGGEALLRRDCFDTIATLSAAGIHTVLTTNGWLLDDRRTDQLTSAGLGRLKISLDSPIAEEHDAFRRRPGSYSRAIQALRIAVQAGLRVYLSTVLTATNRMSLDGFVEIAQREGAAGIGFIPFRPAGKGVQLRAECELDAEQLSFLHKEVARLRLESGLDLLLSGDPDDGLAELECGCGIAHVTVRPNGDVSPCNFAEEVIGNLTRDSLVNLWRTSPALQAWRARGGCSPAADQPAPANPGAPYTPDSRRLASVSGRTAGVLSI